MNNNLNALGNRNDKFYEAFEIQNKMKKLFYLIALVAFTLTSCDKNEADFNNNVINESNTGILIKKVKKLENPYSVSNMKKAYSALQQDGLMKAPLNFDATHLYVRFLPKDSADLETLKNDTTLVLFSYPLDYQLTEGEKYIDSTLIGNNFTWLYTKVPVNYTSPISGFEVLEELYLPMENDTAPQQTKQQKVSSSFKDYWSILEEKSLILTGNYEEKTPYTGMQKAKWWPTATIRVKDDVTGYFIPLQGVKVRARWWFNWETGETNSEGYAKMSGSFSGKLNWSIVWEGEDWDIREGFYGQAYYNGPNGTKSSWALDIDKGGLSFIYAHVHRACFTYWHNNLDLKTPFNDNFWKQKIKIGVYGTADRAFMQSGYRWLLGSMIHIYKFTSDNTEKDCSSIMLTTAHELAHVSHWDMNSTDFSKADDKVVESWAVGVAYVITTQFYSSSIIDHGNWQNLKFSDLTGHYENKYTPLVIDLIDNYDQRAKHSGLTTYPTDSVSGYTISQIENSLKGVRTLQQWRDNLRNEYANSTENYLNTLFDNYINMK